MVIGLAVKTCNANAANLEDNAALQQNEGNNAASQQNVISSMQNRFAGLGNLVLASLLRRG